MSVGPSSLLGRCVFATRRGLAVHGDGALAEFMSAPQMVEFRGRGGDSQALPAPGETVVFRRVVHYECGSQAGLLDLIGVLESRRDASNRPGFAGAGVAVGHRALEAYAPALQEAQALARQADAALAEGSVERWRQRPDPEAADGQRRRFRPEQQGERRTILLHALAPAAGESAVEALRQIAWVDRYAGAEVRLYEQPRAGSVPVDGTLFAHTRQSKQREIDALEAGLRDAYEQRLDEIEHEYQEALAAATRWSPQTSGSASLSAPDESGGRKSGGGEGSSRGCS